MAYLEYLIRPMQHLLDASAPALHQDFAFAGWPTQDVVIDQKSVQKRPGYIEDRDLGGGVDVQQIIHFLKSDGNEYTVYLTDTNACERESSGTWSYITETYTTGAITGITGAVVTGDADVNWDTGSINPVPGDYFIMDDDLSAASEPDDDWAEIETVGSDTEITLVDSYRGATSSGDYTIRRVYSVPTNERWSWAIVKDRLCFTNGSVDVQGFTGSGNAAALDTTYAKQARYCTAFADRLVLADIYESTTRYGYRLRTSANGDPTDWTDSTAVDIDICDTEDYITGLGKSGTDLIIYKSDSYAIGQQSGIDTAPITISKEKRGIGSPAPYGRVPVLGTDAFVGRNDFYIMESGQPVSIGEPIRHKFFSLINPTELKRVFGYHNLLRNQVRWFATDNDNNRLCFVWDWKRKEWTYFNYYHSFSCGGRGEI